MLELLPWIFAGCFLGIFTGLTPGVHVNLLSLLMLSFAEPKIEFVLLIVAMSIVHSFLDFVPSILFGAPEEENFLSVLPGHRYLLKGKGFRAIKLTVFGGVIAGVMGLLLLPVFLIFVEKTFEFLRKVIFFILVIVLFLMIFSEKGKEKKAIAVLVILLSGILGVISLNKGIVRQPLFVCITGFFAVSTLLHSITQNESIKKQEIGNEKFSLGNVFKGSVIGLLAGSTVSLIPSIGASEAAFLARQLIGRIKIEVYLVAIGATNTVNIMFSFFTLYAIGKTRSGVAAIVKQIFTIEEQHLILLSGTILIAIAFGAIACIFIGKFLVKKIHLVPYKKINITILAFLLVLCYFLSGIIGLLVMIVCCAIGLITITSNIRRTHCMALLMIPAIIIYVQFI